MSRAERPNIIIFAFNQSREPLRYDVVQCEYILSIRNETIWTDSRDVSSFNKKPDKYFFDTDVSDRKMRAAGPGLFTLECRTAYKASG